MDHVNWNLIEETISAFGIQMTGKTVCSIDYTKIPTRNDVNPSSLYFLIKTYVKNILDNKTPNIQKINLDIDQAFLSKNMELLESIITTLSKKHYFLKSFLPLPTNKEELDRLILCLQLVHVEHKPTLNIIADATKKFETQTIFIDPIIIQSISKNEYFPYHIYSLRNVLKRGTKLTNCIHIVDIVNFLKSENIGQKYLTKKVKKACENKRFFHNTHDGKVYFNKLDNILRDNNRYSSSGAEYFVPHNLNDFVMVCHHTIATMAYIQNKNDQGLPGRSIATIANHTHYSKSTVKKHLKSLPRIHRNEVVKTFDYYEDALEFVKGFNITHKDEGKFMFINKSFFKNKKEVFLNVYEARLKKSNFYIPNCIRIKIYIRDFHESYVLDKKTNTYKATKKQHEINRRLSEYKTVKTDAIIEKNNYKPTIQPQFPFSPSDHPCNEKRHNPEKRLDYSFRNEKKVDLSVFNNKGTKKRKPTARKNKRIYSKVNNDKFLNLPCYHPYIILSRPARNNYIRFVTNPEYRNSILEKYKKGSMESIHRKDNHLEAFNKKGIQQPNP